MSLRGYPRGVVLGLYLVAQATGPVAQTTSQTEPPERVAPDASCVTGNCHGADISHPNLHWRGFRDSCRDCHEQEGDFHRFATEATPDLCLVCHDAVLESPHVHDPAREDCRDCHEPHGSAHAQLLTDAQPELCYICHDEDKLLAGGVRHQPVGLGRCTACHEPHAAPHVPLLVKPDPELCGTCHRDIRERVGRLSHKHQPLREGGCLQCHRSHASQHAFLLDKSFPRSIYQGFEAGQYGLCFGCHQESLVTERQTQSATGFRDGARNLHSVHVEKSQRGRSCRACHDPHASDNPFLIAEAPRFGSWEMPMNFRALETGGSCAPGCHQPETYNRKRP